MQNLRIQIDVSPELYLKNPDNSEIGKKIITNSIELIHELGFESFTIKKLGIKIGSPESTVYRYFESKHMILFYLIYWYWSWIEYRLVFRTHNLPSAEQQLETALQILTESVKEDSTFSHINEILLDRIIMTEAVKAYSTNRINTKSTHNHFSVYQRVVQRVSYIILEINESYQYPHMLVSTVIEGAHHQRFFAENLPSLTDVNTDTNYITKFYTHLVFNSISK